MVPEVMRQIDWREHFRGGNTDTLREEIPQLAERVNSPALPAHQAVGSERLAARRRLSPQASRCPQTRSRSLQGLADLLDDSAKFAGKAGCGVVDQEDDGLALGAGAHSRNPFDEVIDASRDPDVQLRVTIAFAIRQ